VQLCASVCQQALNERIACHLNKLGHFLNPAAESRSCNQLIQKPFLHVTFRAFAAFMLKQILIQRSWAHPAGPPAQPFLVRKAAAYVTRILSIFGISAAAPDQLGFGGEAAATASASEGAAKYLDAFALFRDTVRSMAKGNKSPGQMLAACDR